MDRAILAAIVFAGFVVRASSIWFGRPEFVGWFNHSYFYWVQVRGLLDTGQLPYPDLPLLFYLYGGVTGLFRALGADLEPSIVHTTRMVMSIAPALVACPVYLIVRRIQGRAPLGGPQWVLVSLSAFLPLTLAHMPELLQKNCLGLPLLGGLMYAVYRLVESRSRTWIVAMAAVFVAIALTHLGTPAVAMLFSGAMLLAWLGHERRAEHQLAALGLAAGGVGVGLACVYTLDADAFSRIVRYAQSSLSGSLLAAVVTADSSREQVLSLLGILIPLGGLMVLIGVYRSHREALRSPDRVFWLGNALLMYLLVLPVLDLDLLPRLLLFMPLPGLVVLGYQLRCHESKRVNRLLVSFASLGVGMMLMGEGMGLIVRASDTEQMSEDLANLRQQFELSRADFVLAPYAVPSVCHWFLGTRAGLITSFNQSQWDRYRRLFVLNPRESRQGVSESGRRTFVTADERYDAMRLAVPLPADLTSLVATDHLEFYELRAIPGTWRFDQDGNWIGWR